MVRGQSDRADGSRARVAGDLGMPGCWYIGSLARNSEKKGRWRLAKP